MLTAAGVDANVLTVLPTCECCPVRRAIVTARHVDDVSPSASVERQDTLLSRLAVRSPHSVIQVREDPEL